MAQRTSIDYTRNVDHAYEQYLLSNEKRAMEAIGHFEEKLHHNSYVKYGRFTIPTFFKPHRIFLVIEGAMALIGGGLFVAGKEYYIALPFFVIAIGLFIRAIKFKKPNEPLQ